MKEAVAFTPELYQLSYILFGLAFSKAIRKLIGKRDKWECQEETCDAAFYKGQMVHASHFNHDRSDPTYDTLEAGEILCVTHHLIYHQDHVGAAEEIGLEECQNDYAITQLKKTNTKVRNK